MSKGMAPMAVKDGEPRAQSLIQKDAAEVVTDGEPKMQMQKVAEEVSIQKVSSNGA